jgi:cytochrome c553
MNSGKIIGLLLSGLIVVLLGYLLMQEADSSASTTQIAVEVVKEAPVLQVKSDEEQKLEELKQQNAQNLNNKVSQLYTVRCKACHGEQGEGSKVAPSIKGKSTEYILSKLDDYKNNRVTNSLMKGLLNNATQDELNTLAQEISSFK